MLVMYDVWTHPHKNEKPVLQKISTLEIVFENLRFNARKPLRLLNGEKNIFVFKNIQIRVDGAKE